MSRYTEPTRAFAVRLGRKRCTFKAPLKITRTRDAFAGSETNDCAVFTLAAILCIPYGDAHALLALAGRDPGRGVYSEQMIRAARLGGYMLAEYAKPREQVTRGAGAYTWTHERRPTVSRVLEFVPARGHFYVSTGHHAFAVIDGVIHDNGALRPRCRISRVFQVMGV